MDRQGTKDTHEREEDEAERLVRENPKVKPPRHDKRREHMDSERDPDLEGDPDLSLNYKNVGGAARVAQRFLGGSVSSYSPDRAMDKNAVYNGVAPYKGQESYVPWNQSQARDLGDSDYSAILASAREWLKAPVLSTSIEGIVPDTQYRAALDLAIRTLDEGKYSMGLQPPIYNDLLARLAGEPKNETLLTIREAGTSYGSTLGGYPMKAKQASELRSLAARIASFDAGMAYGLVAVADVLAAEGQQSQRSGKVPLMPMPKFAAQEAESILSTLDNAAGAIQANHAKWGMSFEDAKSLVNQIDRTADEIEVAAFGTQSFTDRQVDVLKTAQVIQQDSDEKYMSTFKNPQQPIQTESDEPYMSAYNDDQSSAVAHGKSTTGRPLAP